LFNRRGGDWNLLHENLKFAQHLQSTKQIHSFGCNMVVQNNNYREIKDFVKMCKAYSACCVDLQIIEPDFIRDLKHEDYFQEWFSKAVHEKKHKNHEDLLRVIKDPWFDKYVVPGGFNNIELYMGSLTILRQGGDISQYETNVRQYNKRKGDKRRSLRNKTIEDHRRHCREIGILNVPYMLKDKEKNEWIKKDEL